MRNRLTPYAFISLLSLLLALLPVALFADLNSPIEKWQQYWPGRPEPTPHYDIHDIRNLPLPLRVEWAVFKGLVIPPARASKLFGVYPGSYGLQYVNPGSGDHGSWLLPPFTHAFFHLRIAIPFWLLFFIGAYELGILAAGRIRTTTRAV